MTNEQRESLDRVRASYASLNDADHEVGAYRTSDIENVLNLLNQQQVVIDTVRSDLEDVREELITIQDPFSLSLEIVLELVNSTLFFLNEEKEIL